MIRVMFLCHGNICRSVMAEYIFKDMLKKRELSDRFIVKSKAVSSEEIGNDIYFQAKECLKKHHIPYDRHFASKFTKEDYALYDYIFVMDRSNIRNLNYIIDDNEHKVSLLLKDHIISDPWYSGDFETTYNDISKGLELFLEELNLE